MFGGSERESISEGRPAPDQRPTLVTETKEITARIRLIVGVGNSEEEKRFLEKFLGYPEQVLKENERHRPPWARRNVARARRENGEGSMEINGCLVTTLVVNSPDDLFQACQARGLPPESCLALVVGGSTPLRLARRRLDASGARILASKGVEAIIMVGGLGKPERQRRQYFSQAWGVLVKTSLFEPIAPPKKGSGQIRRDDYYRWTTGVGAGNG